MFTRSAILQLRKPLLFLLAFCSSLASFGQQNTALQDSLLIYFQEIKAAAKAHQALWNQDLYGPVLLVNPASRQVYANFPDSAGVLQAAGELYVGQLPGQVNIANTAVQWSGVHWAMIMLPLPAAKQDRLNLLSHELFHKAQHALDFQLSNPPNEHLDQKEGRVYIRLELQALKYAVQAKSKTARDKHLANALTFRKYRHLLYPGADSTENLLELNEGLAEYTGIVISGRDAQEMSSHFEQSMKSFLSNPTFVRSFAYQTIPMYGYLLSKDDPQWNKRITASTQLTPFFIRSFKLALPKDLSKAAAVIGKQYHAQVILAEEDAREEERKRLLAEYKRKFIEQPHFIIPFEQMNISFDPRNIMPVEGKGTVYPNLRVSDKWGVLTVSNGALLSPAWDKVVLTVPLQQEGSSISGEGWVLELKEGYAVVKDENSGSFKLLRK